MKYRIYSFLVFCIFFCFSTNAQNAKYISIELLGSGGIGSINYESCFIDRELVDVHFRAGFSLAPIDVNAGTGLVFPFLLHTTIGPGSHLADFGAGQALTVTTKRKSWIRMPLSFGYRFQPTEKRYYLRCSYTPIVSYIYNFQWEHWMGITFAYRINK